MVVLKVGIVLVSFSLINAENLCQGGKCFTNSDNFTAPPTTIQPEDNMLLGEKEWCFKDLDCINYKEGELSYLKTRPTSPDKIMANFTLYSTKQSDSVNISYNSDSQELPIFLNRSEEWLTIVVHGFGSGPTAPWVSRLRDAALSDIGGHVIVVDWSMGARFPYYSIAAANTQVVGRMIARLVQKLTSTYSFGLSVERLHYIGHSLGAQTGHFFSEYLQQISKVKPAIITEQNTVWSPSFARGVDDQRLLRVNERSENICDADSAFIALDAAGPEFEDHQVFVNRSDADFVEAVHTSGGGSILAGNLGMNEPFGHVDFYANGGRNQPGCSSYSLGCSHSRAYELYLEARMSKCHFISYACVGGLQQYLQNACQHEKDNWSILGLRSREAPGRGVQFFETNAHTPFCRDQVERERKFHPFVSNTLTTIFDTAYLVK